MKVKVLYSMPVEPYPNIGVYSRVVELPVSDIRLTHIQLKTQSGWVVLHVKAIVARESEKIPVLVTCQSHAAREDLGTEWLKKGWKQVKDPSLLELRGIN